MKNGEDPVEAACRELDEETKLVARSAAYLFLHESPSQRHHVCLLDAEGTVELLKEEIGDYRWWDGRKQLPVIPSALEIFERARDGGLLRVDLPEDGVSGELPVPLACSFGYTVNTSKTVRSP